MEAHTHYQRQHKYERAANKPECAISHLLYVTWPGLTIAFQPIQILKAAHRHTVTYGAAVRSLPGQHAIPQTCQSAESTRAYRYTYRSVSSANFVCATHITHRCHDISIPSGHSQPANAALCLWVAGECNESDIVCEVSDRANRSRFFGVDVVHKILHSYCYYIYYSELCAKCWCCIDFVSYESRERIEFVALTLMRISSWKLSRKRTRLDMANVHMYIHNIQLFDSIRWEWGRKCE